MWTVFVMKALDQPHAALPHVVLVCCQLMFAVMQGIPGPIVKKFDVSASYSILWKIACF